MKDTVILVTNNSMGKADLPLGQKLIGKYFELLALHTDLPAAICFYTEGVKLVIDDSPVLGQLKGLKTKACTLLSVPPASNISRSKSAYRSASSAVCPISSRRR